MNEENKVSCLKRGSKMNYFLSLTGQRLKAAVAHLYPNLPWVSPPAPYGITSIWFYLTKLIVNWLP